jgi:hypothetical protein
VKQIRAIAKPGLSVLRFCFTIIDSKNISRRNAGVVDARHGRQMNKPTIGATSRQRLRLRLDWPISATCLVKLTERRGALFDVPGHRFRPHGSAMFSPARAMLVRHRLAAKPEDNMIEARQPADRHGGSGSEIGRASGRTATANSYACGPCQHDRARPRRYRCDSMRSRHGIEKPRVDRSGHEAAAGLHVLVLDDEAHILVACVVKLPR